MDLIPPDMHLPILARLVLKAPGRRLGRTQLMKLCYFLQEIEQVPIRYDFRLFNYGPFDSEVLYDPVYCSGIDTGSVLFDVLCIIMLHLGLHAKFSFAQPG